MDNSQNIIDKMYSPNFDGLTKLEITIANPTGLAQFVSLFNYSIQSITSQYPLLQFSGVTGYDYLIQDIENNPIKASKILFVSTSQGQLANPVFVQKKDSNGQVYSYNEFPIIGVDTNQQQGNRVEVVFDELLLDGLTSFSNYRINAGESVTMVFYYRQMKRIYLQEFPQLFQTKKSISGEIKSNLDKIYCDREKDARGEDEDWKCKEGKNIFQLTIKNNSSQQQFVNLFDNYSLVTAQNLSAPVNTFNTNAGNYSKFFFLEWNVDQQGYTIGGALQDRIVAYDYLASPRTEYVQGATIRGLQLSNITNKIYYSSGANVFELALGTGNAPLVYPQGGTNTQALILDEVNNYLFVLRSATNDIVRLDLNNLASSTTFTTVSVPNVNVGGFNPATNEVIIQRGLDLIGINALTGVITTRFTLGLASNAIQITYIPEWNAIAVTYAQAFTYNLVLFDTSFNVIGSYSSLATSWNGFTFDKNRMELVLPESTSTIRTLFFTYASIQAGTFSSFFSTGFNTSVAGYLSASQTILLGRFTFQPTQSLSRMPTVQFLNPDSYNYFTQSLDYEPMLVSCMDVIAQNQQQLTNNIVIQKKDANGYINSVPESPIIKVDTFQEQGGRAFLELQKLILDGTTTFASYPLNGGETVTLVLYYRQFKRLSILSDANMKKSKLKSVKKTNNQNRLKNNVANTKKRSIFDTEQVYSDGLSKNRSDILLSYNKNQRVKYSNKIANCDIPKHDNQALYVNPNDLSFGSEKQFPVIDISEQGFSQFGDDKDVWSFQKSKEQFEQIGGKKFIQKRKVKN
jgi:hypothetical protein